MNIKRYLIYIVFLGFFLITSCGEKRKVKKPSLQTSTGVVGEYEKSLNAGAGNSSGNVFDLSEISLNELELLSLPELEELNTELKERDDSEKDQIKDLKVMNKALCIKLQETRSQCTAIVRLIQDASIKLLACEGNRKAAGAPSTLLKIRMAQTGKYQLIANKTIYTRGEITSGESEVTFEGPGGEPNRIIDISEWRLKRLDGDIGEPGSLGFSFIVNEKEVFNSSHLRVPNSGENDYLEINPSRIQAMLDTPECKVSENEIVELKRKAINEK